MRTGSSLTVRTAERSGDSRRPIEDRIFVTPTAVIVLDGVAVGVDVYGTPVDWHAAIGLALAGPQKLVDLVHAVEETDPQTIR